MYQVYMQGLPPGKHCRSLHGAPKGRQKHSPIPNCISSPQTPAHAWREVLNIYFTQGPSTAATPFQKHR